MISSLFWEFIFNGRIAPCIGPGDIEFMNGSFFVTEYGNKWLHAEKQPVPEDPEGFIKYLGNLIEDIDNVVMVYLKEALSTFKTEIFFASAVMRTENEIFFPTRLFSLRQLGADAVIRNVGHPPDWQWRL